MLILPNTIQKSILKKKFKSHNLLICMVVFAENKSSHSYGSMVKYPIEDGKKHFIFIFSLCINNGNF